MIYGIAEVGNRDAIKIGHTMTHGHASVRLAGQRLSQLQVGNPRELEVIAFAIGDIRREGELHARFREQHIRGEWFRLAGLVLDWVNENAVGRMTAREIAEENARQRRIRDEQREQLDIAEMRQAAIRIRLPRQAPARVVDVSPYETAIGRFRAGRK